MSQLAPHILARLAAFPWLQQSSLPQHANYNFYPIEAYQAITGTVVESYSAPVSYCLHCRAIGANPIGFLQYCSFCMVAYNCLPVAEQDRIVRVRKELEELYRKMGKEEQQEMWKLLVPIAIMRAKEHR